MPFEPGESGNKNGRPKGSLDRVFRRVRELITELVEENLETIQEDFKSLSPKDRLEVMSKLLPFKRKIGRTMIVYLGSSWILIESTSHFARKFDWPASVDDVIFLILIFGLPATVFYVWFHGKEGIQKITKLEIGLQGLNLMIAAFFIFDALTPFEKVESFEITLSLIIMFIAGIILSRRLRKRTIPAHYVEEEHFTNTDIRIQPYIKGGSFWVILKGLIIQFIPILGSFAVLVQGIYYLTKKTKSIYALKPDEVPDRRFNVGYRVDEYFLVKTNDKRQLQDHEIKRRRDRGILYLLSIVVFWGMGYYVSKYSDILNNDSGGYLQVSVEKGVNVREEPNLESEVVLAIPSGDSAKILDQDGPLDTISNKSAKWYKVSYGDKEGWIWSGLILESD